MVEYRDGKKILVTPISAEDLEDIKIGDIVYLSGSLTTCRDVAHRRVVEEGREIPVDVRNNAILHAGPIIRPLENDKFEMVSVGPTTSMRMEKFEYEFVKITGVRVIVGKGGMKEQTAAACKDFGAIHVVIPAGNAVVAAVAVEEIELKGQAVVGGFEVMLLGLILLAAVQGQQQGVFIVVDEAAFLAQGGQLQQLGLSLFGKADQMKEGMIAVFVHVRALAHKDGGGAFRREGGPGEELIPGQSVQR